MISGFQLVEQGDGLGGACNIVFVQYKAAHMIFLNHQLSLGLQAGTFKPNDRHLSDFLIDAH
ncbi:hypothetical protein D3C78_1685400 [compost metagenome]